MLIVVIVACIAKDNFGEGSNPTIQESYQWGSSSNTDSGDTANTDTASTNDDPTIGYAVGNKAPNLLSTDQMGAPWSLYEQNTPLLILFGHMDTNALPMMIEQARECGAEIPIGVLVGRSIFSSPATPSDVNSIVLEYDLAFALVDNNQDLVNEWTQRNPPKSYLISSEHIIRWSGFQTIDCSSINQGVE